MSNQTRLNICQPDLESLLREWVPRLRASKFSEPVTHVYNPLDYAQEVYLEYWNRFGRGPKEVVFVGMNPGPWGMAQSGVPFGAVSLARDYLGLSGRVIVPSGTHPNRPILGWDSQRREVSGSRLWGLVQRLFPRAEQFFEHAYICSICPLMFLESSGRNRTPDKLPKREREPMLRDCLDALTWQFGVQRPSRVVAIGKWAEQQLRSLLADGQSFELSSIPHPSPANPAANRGWGREMEEVLRTLPGCQTGCQTT